MRNLKEGQALSIYKHTGSSSTMEWTFSSETSLVTVWSPSIVFWVGESRRGMTAHGLHNEIRISHCDDRGCDELQKWFLFLVGQKHSSRRLSTEYIPYLLIHIHCESLVSQYSPPCWVHSVLEHVLEVLVSIENYPDKAEFQDETPFYNWLDSLQGPKPPITWPVSNHRPLVEIKVHTFCSDGSCLNLPDSFFSGQQSTARNFRMIGIRILKSWGQGRRTPWRSTKPVNLVY